jgi:hypothetical protein
VYCSGEFVRKLWKNDNFMCAVVQVNEQNLTFVSDWSLKIINYTEVQRSNPEHEFLQNGTPHQQHEIQLLMITLEVLREC